MEIPVELKGKQIEVEGEMGLLVSVRDISQRREARKKHWTISQGSSQAIYLFQDGKFKYVNEIFEEITGYSQDELLNINFLELIPPDYRENLSRV